MYTDLELNLTTREMELALQRAALPVDPDNWSDDDTIKQVESVLNTAQALKVARIMAHRVKHAQGVTA